MMQAKNEMEAIKQLNEKVADMAEKLDSLNWLRKGSGSGYNIDFNISPAETITDRRVYFYMGVLNRGLCCAGVFTIDNLTITEHYKIAGNIEISFTEDKLLRMKSTTDWTYITLISSHKIIS